MFKQKKVNCWNALLLPKTKVIGTPCLYPKQRHSPASSFTLIPLMCRVDWIIGTLVSHSTLTLWLVKRFQFGLAWRGTMKQETNQLHYSLLTGLVYLFFVATLLQTCSPKVENMVSRFISEYQKVRSLSFP